VHLLQVWPVPETPRLWQDLGRCIFHDVAGELGLVEKPGQFRPTAQALFKLYAVGVRSGDQHDQVRCAHLLANRLRAQENGANGLLHLPELQPRLLGLDRPRLGQLALQDRGPFMPTALGDLARGNSGQFACRLCDALLVRRP
jgi:hypothetical protein